MFSGKNGTHVLRLSESKSREHGGSFGLSEFVQVGSSGLQFVWEHADFSLKRSWSGCVSK